MKAFRKIDIPMYNNNIQILKPKISRLQSNMNTNFFREVSSIAHFIGTFI